MNCATFILTRFNLSLWPADKNGKSTRTGQWLQQRFELFERFCFPSVQHQSVQDFEWIVLFDSETPAIYRDKMKEYKRALPGFMPYFVPAKSGLYFAYIFQSIVSSKVAVGDKVITTYLDNDDALRFDYIETVKRLAAGAGDSPMFISFKYGLQYFTSLNIALSISFPTNHFISLAETYTEGYRLKTVFGYGSHMGIEGYRGTRVLYVDDREQAGWVEVVHESNVVNEVRLTWKRRLVRDIHKLQEEYGIAITLSRHSIWIYYTGFVLRMLRQGYRRLRL